MFSRRGIVSKGDVQIWRIGCIIAWKSENTRIFGLSYFHAFAAGVLGVMFTWYKYDCRTSCCSSATMEIATSFYVLLAVASYLQCTLLWLLAGVIFLDLNSSDVISLKIYSDWLWQTQSTLWFCSIFTLDECIFNVKYGSGSSYVRLRVDSSLFFFWRYHYHKKFIGQAMGYFWTMMDYRNNDEKIDDRTGHTTPDN